MITHSFLKELLDYDPETGVFRWKVALNNRHIAGMEAGSDSGHGYVVIRISGTSYKAHRLAWFYHYGKWPEQLIDHINRDRKDNRISNLRDVSHLENMKNTVAYKDRVMNDGGEIDPDIRVGGIEKKKGYDVYHRKDRDTFRARISIGCYPTLEEAEEACRKAMVLLYPNEG